MQPSFDDITDAMILDQLATCKIGRVVWHGRPDNDAQKVAMAAEQLAGLKVADVRKQLAQGGRGNDTRVFIRRAIASTIVQVGFADATILVDWE